MSQQYSDPKRASDPHALPDLEVWEIKGSTTLDEAMYVDANGEESFLSPGWYYWFCLPGCMPDSDPMGPFATEAEALADAREGCEDE